MCFLLFSSISFYLWSDLTIFRFLKFQSFPSSPASPFSNSSTWNHYRFRQPVHWHPYHMPWQSQPGSSVYLIYSGLSVQLLNFRIFPLYFNSFKNLSRYFVFPILEFFLPSCSPLKFQPFPPSPASPFSNYYLLQHLQSLSFSLTCSLAFLSHALIIPSWYFCLFDL